MSTYSFPKFMKSFEKIEPLDNIQIKDKCEQLKIKNFEGIFMRNELTGKSSKNECLILNHDHSSNEGTHWTCLFVKDDVAYYFDSFGFDPPLEIISYTSNCIDRNSNSDPIQKWGQVICGHLCIYMLYQLNNECSYWNFYDILDELYVKNYKK